MTKKKGQQDDRCQCRTWELIFNTDTDVGKKYIEKLLDYKWGIYKAFSSQHKILQEEKGSTHTHIGLIFREKKPELKFSKMYEYFTIDGVRPNVVAKLGKYSEARCVIKRLQTYYDYCNRADDHPNQDIQESYLHKFQPTTAEMKLRPREFIEQKIFSGMSLIELEDFVDGDDQLLKHRAEALRNFDKYSQMITTLTEIRDRKKRDEMYKDMTKIYRIFQSGLTNILDNQSDRGIGAHIDPGDTGKNKWLEIEDLRSDTCIMQSAGTKHIAKYWDPIRHKRIIFDIPRGKMQFLNTSVIEKLKNGYLFSEKFKSKMKRSSFKPKIMILGNELPPNNWTKDRLTMTTTNKESGYDLLTLDLDKEVPSFLLRLE